MVGASVALVRVVSEIVRSPPVSVRAGDPPYQVPPLIRKRMPAGMSILAPFRPTPGPRVTTMSIGVVAPGGGWSGLYPGASGSNTARKASACAWVLAWSVRVGFSVAGLLGRLPERTAWIAAVLTSVTVIVAR